MKADEADGVFQLTISLKDHIFLCHFSIALLLFLLLLFFLTVFLLLLMGPSGLLFYVYLLFDIADRKQMININFANDYWFKLQTSGVGSNRFANWATTTAQFVAFVVIVFVVVVARFINFVIAEATHMLYEISAFHYCMDSVEQKEHILIGENSFSFFPKMKLCFGITNDKPMFLN